MTVCGSVRGERCCLVKDQYCSPQITHVSWGRLEVEGKAEPYKDAKLFFRRLKGVELHVPGIQPADVQELLDHGANVVVLSRGMAECLRVSGETLNFLKERRVEAHILPTTEAAELYKDRKSTRLNSSHRSLSRMPSSA